MVMKMRVFFQIAFLLEQGLWLSTLKIEHLKEA